MNFYDNYPAEYEYTEAERKKIEIGIATYFQYYHNDSVYVAWYMRNDPVNVEDKIDSTIMVINDKRILHTQIKSSSHRTTFSVGRNTLCDYIENYHNLEALIVAFLNQNTVIMFNWFEFVDYVKEEIDYWEIKENRYYVIDAKELLQDIGGVVVNVETKKVTRYKS